MWLLPVPLRNLQGNERMRIAEIEIHQLAFDREALVFEVSRGERMVGVGTPNRAPVATTVSAARIMKCLHGGALAS
jgi:hypothetical protein